ncbi:unnamed protein product [Coffea canephora]|uniref:Uncharacterized protein n=1 Tax=Coffea canephora TaxID=49390 RepID=A0A068U6H2_COFCA|nr:unnamed protein product [Coffea canephora]
MGNYSDAHICQCLSRLMTLRRNSTVMINVAAAEEGDCRKTGVQFAEGVLRLADGLLQLGLKPGHVVAIAALNSDSYLEWLLAVTYAGGIAAPFNYRWSLQEARLAMNEVKPMMLVTDKTHDYWHFKLQTDLRWHVSMTAPKLSSSHGDVLTTELLKSSSLNSARLLCAPNNAALLCFTSGTSGRPKGVMLSHSALIVQSLAKLALVGYSEDDIYLHTSPLCHIGGISSALAMLMVGGCHVFIPKFEVKSAIRVIEQHHVTSFITVPAMMADLISSARTTQTTKNFETVNKILNGAGGLLPGLLEGAVKVFPRAKLISAYGMTEACSSLTFMTLYDPTIGSYNQHRQMIDSKTSDSVQQFAGVCVGKPAPHVELRISSNGSPQVGKILTRGPHVMLGYWGQIPSKSSSPADEGWFDTGDIGQTDECGNLWLIGRNGSRIKSGGENIYPEEVEAVILQHPGISRVIVVGLPDSRLTEMVVACIRLKDNWQWDEFNPCNDKDHCLSKEILQQFCKDKNLTGFKIPRNFMLWRTPFPMTTTGKLRRDEVKKEAMSRWVNENVFSSGVLLSSNL